MSKQTDIHQNVLILLALLDKAGAVSIGTSLLHDWQTCTPTGQHDNEVVRLSWVDSEGDISCANLSEGAIASGIWNENSFHCQDHEGDDVALKLYSLAPLSPREDVPMVLSQAELGIVNSALDTYFASPASSDPSALGDQWAETCIYTLNRRLHSKFNVRVVPHPESATQPEAPQAPQDPEHAIQRLAIEVNNSESNDGCEDGYTVVHRPPLMKLLEAVSDTDVFSKAHALKPAQDVLASAMQTVANKYRVLGAHPNGNFFDIEVEAHDGLKAFGVAARVLNEANEEEQAEFFAAIPAGAIYYLPGDGVVTLETVLDPDQAYVFGLE